ncbi:AbrB family transcriptional regulator [Edwardsiella tarda]|uniref:AbrB family transcriptional regulator n=1 Tax=Edwardsiella tarda TaxID=636 RepID=UPI003A868D58
MGRLQAQGKQWALLALFSLGLGMLFLWLHLPAALLLGPMLAAVVMGLRGATIRVHGLAMPLAQSILGCMIARSLSLSLLTPLLDDWPIVLLVLLCTQLCSGVAGWLLVRLSDLPGPTGAWGSSPGGASAMVAMAGEFGADVRLVAFMQYLRVLFVAMAAALVVRLGVGDTPHVSASVPWFPPLGWAFVATLLIAGVGGWLGQRLHIPAGALLLPMLIGALCNMTGVLTPQTPEWLLVIAYTLIGWHVGLLFTRAIFQLALRTLPQILLSIATLMALCALMAWGLTQVLPIDPLSAYLATSPGGLDTIAIIAAGSQVNLAFVMALQMLRLFTILLIGPPMARWISRHAVSSP